MDTDPRIRTVPYLLLIDPDPAIFVSFFLAISVGRYLSKIKSHKKVANSRNQGFFLFMLDGTRIRIREAQKVKT
jgi:hypothetical protein